MTGTVTQISVFLENRPGTLAKVTGVLAQAGTEIIALTVAEADQFGILRMILSNPDAAAEALEGSGHAYRKTDVVAVELGDDPASPNRLFSVLGDAGINIDYLYVFMLKSRDAPVAILRTNDNLETTRILEEAGFGLIESDELHSHQE